MVERGVESETLDSRLKELEKRKKDTELRLDAAKSEYLTLDKTVIVGWLSQFLSGDIEDEDFRRHMIDTLINSVTVWDEPDGGYKITTVYNLKGNTQTYRVNADGSSDMKRNSPPKKRQFSCEDCRFFLFCMFSFRFSFFDLKDNGQEKNYAETGFCHR